MIVAPALLAILVAAPVQAEGHGPGAGTRRPIAGMAGVRFVSTLRREDSEEAVGRSTLAFVFPDRLRWHFEGTTPEGRVVHQFYYRHGEEVQAFPGGGASVVLEPEQRDVLVLQTELRRGLLCWPDGFTWSGEGRTREAPVLRDTCCDETPIGSLVATMDADRPLRVEVRDASGAALEALEVRDWQELGGRAWPRVLALLTDGAVVLETIESVETRVQYLELAFVAPDRRPRGRAGTSSMGILARDLVGVTYAAHALPRDVGWEEAAALARAHIDGARDALADEGLDVDPVPTFELSPEGVPVRCLVRLAVPRDPPPEGFLTHPERPGLLLPLGSLDQVGPDVLRELGNAVPEGASPGTPYLRLHQRAGFPVELVLPLVP